MADLAQIEIPVESLLVGMYVSALDRPWLGTPFKLQGLQIESQRDIDILQSLCKTVFIDVSKGRGFVDGQSNAHAAAWKDKDSNAPLYSFASFDIRHNAYGSSNSFQQESPEAFETFKQLEKHLEYLTLQVNNGRRFGQLEIKNLAGDLVNSVIRNPDVMAWLIRVKQSDDYLHHHSLRCAVWAALLGRHIGLRRLELELLTQAMLLKDIGKTRLPDELLVKAYSQLNTAQRSIYRKHVAISIELLKQVDGLNPKVISIIAAHCEHYDGSGYPKKLKGDEIYRLSIIAGLACYYDELIYPRDVQQAIAPSAAVRELYAQSNKRFQDDIVKEFIQALGIYPAGSIVELNTGELAVVLEQIAERRLRPKLAVVTDSNRQALAQIKSLDLLSEALALQQVPEKGKQAHLPMVYIVRDLSPQQCDIDLLKVRQSLFEVGKSRFGLFSTLKSIFK